MVGTAAALMMAAAAAAAASDPPPALPDALAAGVAAVDLRLRTEHVDNESATQMRDATATTLRARLGFATGKWKELDAAAEYEGVTAFDKLDYDNGTAASTQRTRAVVADPTGSELNQAWLRYTGIPKTTAQVGRQRLSLDNQRWIGNVGWRQNEQTYDGAVLGSRALPGTDVTYAYFHNVNSVLFTNFPLKANLVNVSYSPGAALKATAYGYWLDFVATNAGNRQDSRTAGVRFSGTPALTETVKLFYTAEYAQQSAYEEASAAADDVYLLAELGSLAGATTLKLGYEVLGSSDGSYAVQTPLATLHAHDGWADLFLVTPAAGLRRLFVHAGTTLAGVALSATVHRFSADFGGAVYGEEIDVSAGYGFTRQFSGLAKYARYDAASTAADSFAGNVDTEKGWLQLEYKF